MSSITFSPEVVRSLEADDLEKLKSLLYDLNHQTSPVSELDKLLAHAIDHNAILSIDYLLALGANPLSETAFEKLLGSSSFAAFQHLIKQGTLDINQNLDWLGTFLILAIKRNDLEHVSFCLEHGANPNLGLFARVWTALATAAEYGASLQIVEGLLSSGADVKGSDALQTSAKKNRVDLMQALLNNGADIDEIGFEYCATELIADEAGSALHYAVDGGSVDAMELLLKEGANAGTKDAKGRTAAERGAEKGSDVALKVLQVFSTTS